MPTDIFPIATANDDGSGYFSDAFFPPTTFNVDDDDPDGNVGVARYFSSPTYVLANVFLRWNTSSIPDNAIITDAELAIVYLGMGGAETYSVIGQWYDFGGEPPVSGDMDVDGSTYDAIAPQPTVDFPPVPVELVWPIADLTGINKSGYTGIRLKLTGGTPTTGDYHSFATYEHATQPPAELRVTYSLSDRVYKRLYGPAQLAASAADLYTCPASTVARVLNIHASNPSGSPVDINLSIGADATGTRIFDDYAVPADGIVRESYPYELAAGEKIQGWADSAGTVVLSITGYEEPA